MRVRQQERDLSLTDYNFKYIIKEPSKVSDYDYDLSRPGRRFISTYIHELKVYDKILNTEVLALHFSSETCASIVASLYNILCGTSNSLLMTVKNVYIDGNPYPKILAIHRFKLEELIQLSILGSDIDSSNIIIRMDQLEAFIELLESDELINMFIGN